MSTVVMEILERIRALSDEDRCMLESELAREAEAAWQDQARQARLEAARRGIDDQAVIRAIEESRYGG